MNGGASQLPMLWRRLVRRMEVGIQKMTRCCSCPFQDAECTRCSYTDGCMSIIGAADVPGLGGRCSGRRLAMTASDWLAGVSCTSIRANHGALATSSGRSLAARLSPKPPRALPGSNPPRPALTGLILTTPFLPHPHPLPPRHSTSRLASWVRLEGLEGLERTARAKSHVDNHPPETPASAAVGSRGAFECGRSHVKWAVHCKDVWFA